jgi:hypothetical protein
MEIFMVDHDLYGIIKRKPKGWFFSPVRVCNHFAFVIILKLFLSFVLMKLYTKFQLIWSNWFREDFS